MGSEAWRPIGVPSQDDQQWLARFATEQELRAAYLNATNWLSVMESGRAGHPREQGIRHWRHRIQLLKSKALLMGIQLED